MKTNDNGNMLRRTMLEKVCPQNGKTTIKVMERAKPKHPTTIRFKVEIEKPSVVTTETDSEIQKK